MAAPAFPVSSLALSATALRAGWEAFFAKSLAPFAAIPPIFAPIPLIPPPDILEASCVA